MAPSRTSLPPDHLSWLDGLRGVAALWVFLSHVQILTGLRMHSPLSYGASAVDLFMMLSGFLMVHHYLLRQSTEPWQSCRTWMKFWVRRYFRISPAYYVLLIVALLGGAVFQDARQHIALVWSWTGTAEGRYTDTSSENILAHLTYVFGLMPDYAFKTVLPDWSIGLEMQFYAIFPLLMLLVARCGRFITLIGALLICVALQWAFPHFIGKFDMPSFLPMKLYVFVIGMFMAFGFFEKKQITYFILSLCIAIIHFYIVPNVPSALLICVVFGMYFLMGDLSLPGYAKLTKAIFYLRAILSNKVARFAGDTAYGVYLIHLLLLVPVAGWLATKPQYVALPAFLRFVMVAVVIGVFSYSFAWLVFRYVERPGVVLGKRLIASFARGGAKDALSK